MPMWRTQNLMLSIVNPCFGFRIGGESNGVPRTKAGRSFGSASTYQAPRRERQLLSRGRDRLTAGGMKLIILTVELSRIVIASCRCPCRYDWSAYESAKTHGATRRSRVRL